MCLTDPAAPPRFVVDLARHGNRPAVLAAGETLSYAELARRVAEVAAALGPVRRLVALAADNSIDSLVGYLAALAGNHPLILAPAGNAGGLRGMLSVYNPDVVLSSAASPCTDVALPAAGALSPALLIDERRPGSAHVLHPQLALLLSTSGSTGSPKLVRLSHRNLESNAEAIAGYLGISEDDRAATTLPMHYCYGLSVVNSHLLRGAGLVLTDLSVVDPCFWELFQASGATTFAAVPYTFELLDRVGFAKMDLPRLRYITQAGGRIAPESVRRYAELGQDRGWDLVVMYGQTEATARMAYLPPHLAARYPESIGVPIPGGTFRIDPVAGLEHGELVYTGPNVMLGYAETPADLADGRTVHELRTGDLAQVNDAGLYKVVGRLSRFVKILGLRVDLGQVERTLADLGLQAAVAGDDQRVVIAVQGDHDCGLLARMLAGTLGLPRAAVEVVPVGRLPRLASGKADYPAVLALAAPAASAAPASAGTVPSPGHPDLRAVYAEQLERDDVGEDSTFVSLGGDSLSYVAASVRLERELGTLPSDWHLRTVRELQALTGRADSGRSWRERLGAPMETGIVLRAVAIVFIVNTHVGHFVWPGTAHILMAVAGFNFARFHLAGDRRERRTRQLRSLGRIVLPSVAFIAFAYLVTDTYGLQNILLMNSIVGSETWTDQWQFWFVEMLVYVGVGLLLTLPWVDRVERRFAFGFPLALMGLGLLGRFGVVGTGVTNPEPVLWLFALGWATARAQKVRERLLLATVAVLTVPGFFGDVKRDATILVGVLALIWLPRCPVPLVLHNLLAVLASASLYVYLTHWLVYPELAKINWVLAVVVSLAVGVGYWALTVHGTALVRRLARLAQARRLSARHATRHGARHKPADRSGS
jgi:acyl-CoA synthetase (AMP-forming)/AMP-acid ligase II/acyl carrier protein